jgi:O-antigen ligase
MLPLVAIGLFATGLLWFLLVLWRFPAQVGLCLLTAAVFIDCLEIVTPIDAGIFIAVDDVASIVLLSAAAIIAIKDRKGVRYVCPPALLLLGLAALNFARGAILFGIKPAGNGVRYLVYLIAPFIGLTVIGPKLQFNFSRATTWLSGLAFLFTAIALCRWAHILPVPDIEFDEDFRQIPRVLPSDYPMVIGQALILAVGLQLSRGVRLSGILKAVLFGAIVLLMQHRSVWSATAMGMAWLVFRSLRSAPLKQWIQFGASAAGVTLVATVLIVASGRTEQLTSMLKANIDETKQQDSTFAWRLDGFAEAIDRTFSGAVDEIVLGPPAGRDLTGIASQASTHIHNRYIDTLAYYGVLGLLLLLAWFWMLASRVVRMEYLAGDRAAADLAGPILQAILLSEFTYFLVYFGNLLHGALLGLLWTACAEVPERRPLGAAVRPPTTVPGFDARSAFDG